MENYEILENGLIKQKNITHNVIEIKSQTNKLMEITKKFDKSFILYGDKNYLPIIKKTIQSIRSFSDLPIFVYLLNHHEEIDEKNVFVKKWICNIRNQNEDLFNFEDNGNFYIDRNRVAIYDILIQRPAITKDVLEKFSNVICYLDADTTCLSNLEKIFDLYPDDEVVPYFTKGVYDFMYLDGVGDDGYDLTKTLEHPTCELYNIDQSFRFQSGYRQTGYYLAGQNTIPFINEWTEMCINPIIKDNTVKYAAYHEETIVNCLLWKHKVSRGLPSVYVNGSLETIDLINDNTTFTGEPRHIKDWLLVPSKREELFFIHGEKRLNIIDNMIEKLRTGVHYKDIKIADDDYVINLPQITDKRIKLLFVTPHLSTGGMPQFLLKRIKELQKYEDEIEIFLVEFCLFSDTYIIQRNKILQYLDENHFFNLSIIGEEKEKEKKETLINIIKENNIDIIHFEEITEGFEDFNILSINLLNQIYSSDRTWKIVESCHNIWFNPTNRNFKPEAYSLVTPFHLKETFKNEPSYKELHIYPIEDLVTEIKEKHQIYNDEFTVPLIEKMSKRDQLGLDPFKTHVLNVGLWTSGKNQGEGFEIARNIWEKNKDIHFHFLGNQAPNFEDYWSPIMQNQPPNVTVWYERNDVSDFMIACDVFMFNSKWECNPLVIREAASYGMKILSRNLPQYMGMFDGYITEINDNDENLIESTSDKLLSLISSNKTYKLKEEFDFGKSLRNFYKKVLTLDYIKNKEIKNNYNVFNHYILNPYLEINGSTENELNVRFFDNDQLVYNNNININSWVKMNKQYYTNWRVEVREKDTLIYTNTNDYKGKRVFISFGSKSLGDTLAWFPYVEEFRKKHECELIVSTFLNDLFKDQYPNVEFVEPSDVVHNVVAQYNLGWYYTQKEGTESVFDNNIHKVDFKQIPLQQTASNILGLDYKEIRPKLNLPKIEKKKKVGIGIHSTAQSKYWNNPNGWQEVVNYLRELGYEVMIYSREKDGYMGNKHPKGTTKFKGGSLQEVIDDMSECEFFIGLGSGLSWLAWACKLPVVLISGFSEKWAETTLDTYRVINESVCHGCFNKENFDAGDWNWCPLHKGTDRQFECTKEISSDMVIKEINKIINKESNSDLVTIILSHANTKEKRKILIEHLKTINTKILLSTNYPIDNEIKGLCDYVIYDEENPILLKEDFNKYNVSWYFYSIKEGVEVREYFDYDHGYAVYKLIQNGLIESKKLGFKYSHIINYDYLINENTLQDNHKLLKNYDSVFYIDQNQYRTGFFTGKIDELIKPFTHYNTKDEYYNYDGYNKSLEIIIKDAVKKQNLKVKEFFYEDLKETSIVNRVVDDHKNNKKIIEEKIDEVSFDRGGKDNWYSDATIQEIENDKLIQTMEGFDYSTVNNRCLFDDGVIVDVGCLNWDWSNFFLGKKRVIGIDPFEKQIPFTELFKGVISNYNGTTKMKFSHEASTIINQSEGETVQVRTWGHFCNEYNIKKISVLKINIEGSEYDLLDSLTDDDFNNIDQIAISFHDWMIPEWKPKTERAIRILKSKNYEIQKINDSWGWYLAVKNKSTQEKIMKENEIETRIDIIKFLSKKFNYEKYLEIGLRHPWECFDHINCDLKDSVDPGYETDDNIAKYKYTSDSFFSMLDNGLLDKSNDYKWDIIFIDGLHTAEQVERDIINSLNHLSDNGSIVLHDCNPPTEYHARATYYDFSTPAGGNWNGTVWKAIYKLRCTNPNVDVCVVDTDWGCGVVRKGKQRLCEFDNPFFEYEKFDKNIQKHLNLIPNIELPIWIENPYYK